MVIGSNAAIWMILRAFSRLKHFVFFEPAPNLAVFAAHPAKNGEMGAETALRQPFFKIFARMHASAAPVRICSQNPKSRSKPSRYSSENDVLIEKYVKYTDFFLLSIVYV